MTDVAVLHGNYFARGGGERVADAIADALDAPLYYGFGDDEAIPDDGIDRRKLFDPTSVGKTLARRIHQYRDFRFMWNGMHVPELFEFDAIVQSGNEFGWYVPKQLTQAIVKYVHSPPRGPYDMHYKHGGSRLHRAYSLAAKTLYGHTTAYPDAYLANSEVVATRCRKAWGVEPDIVYPPVPVGDYGPGNAEKSRERTYLTFSRLYRHKRTREIVQAFDGRDGRLIVGGDGPQREHLESIAPSNVDVRGYLSERDKRRLLAECDALVFNAENEDFGLVPIEAFASGTPVIGVRDGFTRHQIRDGDNGLLFDASGTPAAIADALDRFEIAGVSWSPAQLVAFARQFSRDRFDREIQDALTGALASMAVETKCSFDVAEDAREVRQ